MFRTPQKKVESEQIPQTDIQQTFTTQAQILQDLNKYEKKYSMCSPLANEYAECRIKGGKSCNFTKGGDEATFERAMEFKKREIEALKEGKDGTHLGLGSNYQKVVVKAEDLKTEEDFSSKVDNANHSLVTFPVTYPDGTKDTHQVYIGKKSNTDKKNCVYFDANRKGGEGFGTCQDVYNLFFRTIKENTITDGSRPVIIASSNAEIKEHVKCIQKNA